MPFLKLPAEIRQRIFILLLPSSYELGQPFPKQAGVYAQLCTTTRQDVLAAIQIWSPVWRLTSETQMLGLQDPIKLTPSIELRPKLDRICLDFFSDTKYIKFWWTCECTPGETIERYDWVRLKAWIDAIPAFAKSVGDRRMTEIYVDITPAPKSVRASPAILYPDLHNKLPSQTFLASHREYVVDMVRALHVAFGPSTKLFLTGIFSPRSQHQIDWILQQCLTFSDVTFVGGYFTREEGLRYRLSRAVEDIAPEAEMKKYKTEHGVLHPLTTFKMVRWSDKTKELWLSLHEAGKSGITKEDLTAMAHLTTSLEPIGTEGVMKPEDSAIEKWIQLAAKDMNLESEIRKDAEGEVVVVVRKTVVIDLAAEATRRAKEKAKRLEQRGGHGPPETLPSVQDRESDEERAHASESDEEAAPRCQH